MKRSWRVGFSFGLTSGIITTLGLMVGLYSGTGLKLVVIAGILTISIADAFSDSMSIHISQEFENNVSHKEIWESTFSTLVCKFIFSALFILPVLLFELKTAIIISVLIGFYLIFLISLVIARQRKVEAWKVISEHLIIMAIVILVTYYIGYCISSTFG